MKCRVIFMVVLFFASTLAQLGLNEEREDMRRGVNCNLNCHSRSNDPVCGTNGMTYMSICDLEEDICKKVKVKLKHNGECSLAEKCVDERAFRQEQVTNGFTVHVPVCKEDGSYAQEQCHNFTTFCWCSTVDGQIIAHTITQGQKPNCSGDLTSPPAQDPPKQDRCKGRNRDKFFENLTSRLMQGFEVNARGEGRSRVDAIKWKFSQLDTNNDKVLKRREYRRLRKTVKKHVEPKKCSRQFPRFCDNNNDDSISDKEWIDCFSRRSGSSRQQKCRRGKNCRTTTLRPRRPKPSCERERRSLLEEIKSENNSLLIPECQPNGKYQPMQCYKDICVCVDELTGNSLEGTAVENGTPDCTKPMPHVREWPGCTGKNKTKFVQDLKKYLLRKVEDNESTPATVALATHSVEEFAAIYHFQYLDKDKNSILEKRERKDIKKFLKRSPKLRACGKKLAEYCDVNNDNKISQDEWVACVILSPNEGGAIPASQTRRKETNNPFETILKPEP